MKHDYDLRELKKIKVRGLPFYVMPRYTYHYLDNDYESFSLDILSLLLRGGKTAIDIGAHYGIYSLLAAKMSHKVYAFEPVPENYEILKKNIEVNGFSDTIVPINKAVSHEETNVTFNIPWASDSAGFYDHPNAESIRKIDVKTAVIDTELQGVTDLSFIKIDTEGHEIHVLDGMTNVLKNNASVTMLIEFNPECLERAGYEPLELVQKIESLGFDVFAIHETARTISKVDATSSVADILENDTYLNLLCLRKGSWSSTIFLSHSSSIGGAELTLVETIEKFLARTDVLHVPYVVLPAEGPLADRLRKLPVSLKIVPMKGWVAGPSDQEQHSNVQVQMANAQAMSDITSIFRSFKPQTAYTCTMVMPWLAIVAKAFGVPHVWHVHEFGDTDHGFVFLFGKHETLKALSDHASAVIFNSQAVRDSMTREVAKEKAKLLRYNIDVPIVKTKPVVYKNEKSLKLLLSGRIMPSKGQLQAVQALQALTAKNIQAELVLLGPIGEKEYKKEIEIYAKKHSLQDRLHIVGHKNNPFDYVSQADIVLMCSRSEAFGRVTVEAMLLSKPVVGSNSGGTAEIITHGVDGFLYEPQNVDELTTAIEKTMPDVKKMGDMAYKNAKKKFTTNYYNDVYALLHTSSASRNVIDALAEDVLTGFSELSKRSEKTIHDIQQESQKTIQEYNDAYNKTYEAYRIVEERLAAVNNSRLGRLHKKITRHKQ